MYVYICSCVLLNSIKYHWQSTLVHCDVVIPFAVSARRFIIHSQRAQKSRRTHSENSIALSTDKTAIG